MKAHIGVDSRTRTIHTIAASAANVHGSRLLAQLLRGKERRVYGDSAYRGQRDVIRARAKHARDFTNRRAYRNAPLTEADRQTNRRKSAVRSYVEHAFGLIKGRFGFQKVRYRGIARISTASTFSRHWRTSSSARSGYRDLPRRSCRQKLLSWLDFKKATQKRARIAADPTAKPSVAVPSSDLP